MNMAGWRAGICGLAFLFAVSGCGLLSQQAQPQEKKEPVFKPPVASTEAEVIVKDDGEGKYAADRYDEKKVQQELDQFPANLKADQVYARLLALMGEKYAGYIKEFKALETPSYQAELLKLDPNSPQYKKKQPKKDEPKTNAVILFDASGSMNGKVDGETKIDLAKEAVKQFVAQLPEHTKVSLRVYGHKGSNQKKDKALSCKSTEVIYPLSTFQSTSFEQALNSFKPAGWTPLALAIQQAGKDLESLNEPESKNIVYVVSDGIETCGGDPVQAANQLHNSNIKAIVNIIGFDLDDKSKQALENVALAGGGTFQSADGADDFRKAFGQYIDELESQNDNWYANALETINRQYNSDNKMLNNINDKMEAAIQREDKRLNKALDYLYFKKKIDLQLWRDTGDMIDNRWHSLSIHANNRYTEVGDKLDSEWTKQADKIDQLWVENGGKIDELKNIPRIRVTLPNYKITFRQKVIFVRTPRILRTPEQ